MNVQRKVMPFLVAILILAFPSLAMAALFWVPNGIPVCSAINDQDNPRIVPDQAGGTIIAWVDNRGEPSKIYVQHLSANGRALWGPGGMAVCDTLSAQGSPRMIPDGLGGCIILWIDSRQSYSIYGQRIDANGTKSWNPNGVRVVAGAPGAMNGFQEISSDGAGGAVIAFLRGPYPLTPQDIYAQRIDPTGAALWGATGVPVCVGHVSLYCWGGLGIVNDGGGGAIIAWRDCRVGGPGLHAQRVDSLGTPLWTVNGVAVYIYPSSTGIIHLVTDSAGGAIMAFQGAGGLLAQRVAPDSTMLWTPGGIVVCSEAGTGNSQMALFDSSGAYVTWEDSRSGTKDIYAQRIALDGTLRWGTSGVPVCTASGNQEAPQIAEDGDLGVCITWSDRRSSPWPSLYAQRVDSTGGVLWNENGVAVCKYPDAGPQSSQLACGIDGSPTIVWVDSRNGNYDIYAQRVNDNGFQAWPFISAVMDVPQDQGGKLQVSWDRSFYDSADSTEITHYSLWRRLPRPSGIALEGSSPLTETMPYVPLDFKGPAPKFTSGGYSWEWIANIPARFFDSYSYMAVSRSDSMGSNPNWQSFMASAQTSDQLVYYDSAIDSGYSVDNLSPCIPEGLAGKKSFTPAGLDITWDANSESDLGHYAVYRGLTEDFEPAPGNLIASPPEPAYFDPEWQSSSGYYYKVSAIDVHGNEGEHALLRPEDVTGENTPKAPAVSFLSQNYPNPFNPTTRIAFGLAGSAHVRLAIYDAAGRLVRVLIDSSRPAGYYHELWDGRDAKGGQVASGVYFYRLNAGLFTQMKKMVILR